MLSEDTPKSLAELGLFQKTNKLDKLTSVEKADLVRQLEFHDVNEDYEEHRLQNKTIEMRLLSSKNRTNESMDSSEV